MSSSTIFRAGAAGLLFATGVVAQSGARFIGLTHSVPTLQSQDLQTCAARRCAPPGFPSTTLPGAGGTAYDTRTRGTWISNGTRIAKVDSRGQCGYQCPIQGLPNPTVNTYVTGLAYEHRGNRLYVTDSGNQISIYAIQNGCTLVALARCQVVLPLGQTLTGIAIDDVNERVFWIATSLSGPTIGGGTVSVAKLGNVCQAQCTVPVRACPSGSALFGPLTGIAYDACRDAVWVTDGLNTVSARILGSACQIVLGSCCPNPTAATERYVGLCIEPSTEDSVGQSCTNFSCASCNPTHYLDGDPVLGNFGFSVDARDLPAGALAATMFNFGPCDATGFLVPPFCAPLQVPISPTLLAFSANTGGGVGCSGSTNLDVSVAADPNLCGIVVSTQVIGLCINGGAIGTFSTECLSWAVGSS